MIDGVVIQPLKQISDERGKVMHMLRNDSPLFLGFGEIYFSLVYPGAVKAWKKHLKMTQHLAVPAGKIELVIYDGRQDSLQYRQIQKIELGEENYNLVRIPPLVWYGFKGLSKTPALIVNCSNLPHDPQEIERLEPQTGAIPFDWR